MPKLRFVFGPEDRFLVYAKATGHVRKRGLTREISGERVNKTLNAVPRLQQSSYERKPYEKGGVACGGCRAFFLKVGASTV